MPSWPEDQTRSKMFPSTSTRRAFFSSKAFFTALGYSINPQFSDDTCASVVFSDTIYAMLLSEARFKDFTPRTIADARTSTEAIVCLGAASRADVDRFHAFLLREGIAVLDAPAEYPQYGPAYYAVFFGDPDGMKLELVHFPWGYWREVQESGHDERPRDA